MYGENFVQKRTVLLPKGDWQFLSDWRSRVLSMASAPPPDPLGVDTGQKNQEGVSKGGVDTEKELQSRKIVASRATSWVDATKEKKVLRKYELDITNQEGHLNVEIPDEVVVNANRIWEDFLIGKFLDTAPHIAKIHAVVNKIWRGRKGATCGGSRSGFNHNEIPSLRPYYENSNPKKRNVEHCQHTISGLQVDSG